MPECKIAPSLESAVEDHPTVTIQSPHLLHIAVQCLCTHKHPHLTPLRLHLQGHFSEIIIKKDQHPSSKNETKIKPSYYGQALTTDEIVEILLSRDETREVKQKAKTNSKVIYILHQLNRINSHLLHLASEIVLLLAFELAYSLQWPGLFKAG